MRTLVVLALMSILLQTVAPVGAQDVDGCDGLLPSRLLDSDFSVAMGDAEVAMREEPRFDAPIVRSVPPGEVLRYNYGGVCADGARWQRVSWDGDNGWVAEASADTYWLEPYTLPEPVVVSQDDGETTTVVTDLLSFSAPSTFANYVTMQPRIGTNFREAMRVFPNYTQYVLQHVSDGEDPRPVGVIDVYDVYAFARMSTYAEGEIHRLRSYADRQQSLPLTEYETGIPIPPPDLPAGGSAQMLSAAQRYLDFENGLGMRFLSYYGQMLFPVPETVTYRYQGLMENGDLLVSASIAVRVPVDQLPPWDPAIFVTGDDPDGLYRAVAEKAVNAIADADFTPPLSAVDAVLRTMRLKPTEDDA